MRRLRPWLRIGLGAAVLLPVGAWAWTSLPIGSDDVLTLPPVDRLVVDKFDRTLQAWSNGRLVHTFTGIQLGDAPEGRKQFEGDERTPEGRYTIDYRNPQSAYHLSLHISYPDAAAVAAARAAGRSPGGAIFIHGQPNALPYGRVPGDWTDGCIALANEEIEALWDAVDDGTSIEIAP